MLPARRPLPRALFHVQHLLGTGHLRRAAQLAAELVRRSGFGVTLASGGAPVANLELGGAELLQLPPLTASEGGLQSLVTADGRPPDDAWRAARRDRLLRLYAELRPDLVLIEAFPFGRRALRFELLPLLASIAESRPRPLLVASVRDVVHARRAPERIEETVNLVRRHFDRVLIHGDPRLIRLDESFPAFARIADRSHYTGMVSAAPAAVAAGLGEVIVSAGGGATGGQLFAAALAARPLSRLRHATWRLLVGGNLPEASYQALREQAPEGVVVERSRADFRALLAGCAVSVSQGGYNTVADLLASAARAVIVPFEAGGETEQRQRAMRLAELGLVQVVSEETLSGGTLAAALDRALSAAPARHSVDLAGAGRTAELLTDWLAVPREATG